MSDNSGNEQCDCSTSRTFPHRRKKCAFGGGSGKSKPKTTTTTTTTTTANASSWSDPPIHAAAVSQVGSSGTASVEGVAVTAIPVQSTPVQYADKKPTMSERISNAAGNGMVAGVGIGVAAGTATIVRDAMTGTVGAVVNNATGQFRSSLGI